MVKASMTNPDATPPLEITTGGLGGASLYDYWLVLYRHRWMALLVFLSAAASGYGISVVLPPVYEAKAVFYVPANAAGSTFTTQEAANQIASRPMLPTPESKAASVNAGILKNKGFMRRVLAHFPDTELDDLLKNIDVKISGEFLVEIFARNRDPKRAADVAGVMLQEYTKFHDEIARRRAEETEATLTVQRETVMRRIEGLVEQLRVLQEQAGILGPDLAATRMSDLLTESEKRRFVAQSLRIGDLQRRLEAEQVLKQRVDSNLLEAALQKDNPPPMVVTVETPVPPIRPVFPIPILNGAIAGLLGVVVACYYALLLGYLERLRELRVARQMDWSPFLVDDAPAPMPAAGPVLGRTTAAAE